MATWLDEGIGVNHAEQMEYREGLLNRREANYDDYFGSAPVRDDDPSEGTASRHSSMELSDLGSDETDYQETSPFERDVRNGFVSPGNTPPIREIDQSGIPSTSSRPHFERRMSRFPNREGLEPSAGALSTRRRENAVPISIQEDRSTVSRNDGLYRSGEFPPARPMDPARLEAAADYRNNLRPQVWKNRAIGSVRDAGMIGRRAPIASNSRWGRFKDLFRGNGIARKLFRMDSHAKVQQRRLERKLNAERLEGTRQSSLFRTMSSLKTGDQAEMDRLSPEEKWSLTPRNGAAIPEVDDDDETSD